MAQGARPDRVGEEIRQELAVLLMREVHDPGIGFVTLTRTKMSPDLTLARVYYTLMGDAKAKRDTQKALERATPFLRRQIAARVRLRRVPEIKFEYDRAVEHQDRVETLLRDIEEERKLHPIVTDGDDANAPSPAPDAAPEANDGDPAPPAGKDDE
jgi:ribosome-binding factor A